jgi:hypothetical protein
MGTGKWRGFSCPRCRSKNVISLLRERDNGTSADGLTHRIGDSDNAHAFLLGI